MEVDCVRPVGGNIGVSIWIEGKLRAISVSPRIIDPSLPQPVSDDDRCRLVVRHLKRIQRAAADHLVMTGPTADAVLVDDHVMMPLGIGRTAREPRCG